MSLMEKLEEARKRFMEHQQSSDIGTLKGLKEMFKKKEQPSKPEEDK